MPDTDDEKPDPEFAIVTGPALLWIDGWAGRTSQRVEVLEYTAHRVRIAAIERTRLAGRNRWLEPGETALVPNYAVTIIQSERKTDGFAKTREPEP